MGIIRVKGVLHRDGWASPLPVSPLLERRKDELFVDTKLVTSHRVLKKAHKKPVDNPDEVTREMFSRLFTNRHKDKHDKRIFDSLTHKKYDALVDADVTVGEIVFVMVRFADIIHYHSFGQAGSKHGEKGTNTQLRRLAPFSAMISELRPHVPPYEAFGWALLMGQMDVVMPKALDNYKAALERGYDFDRIAPYASLGIMDMNFLIDCVENDIDMELVRAVQEGERAVSAA